MNCDETQERLLDYLDRALDSATIKDLEEHLAWCPRCRAEAEQMAAGLRQVASLMTVDPPLGFTERVMARVHEIEAKPSLWRRLLFPLSIKLPIHATAVVLIGIMALYLLKRVPRGDEVALKAAPPLAVFEEQKAAGLQSEVRGIAGPAQHNEKDSETASVNPQAAESKQKPKAATEKAQFQAGERQTTGLADRQGVHENPTGAPSAVAPEKSNVGAAGAPVAVERKDRAAAAPPTAPLPNSPDVSGSRAVSPESVRQLQSVPDVELVARRARPGNAQGGDNLGALDKTVEREALARRGAAERIAPLLPEISPSDKPHEVWVTITRAQYDQLKKELFAIGPIESESWRSSREKSGAFRADEQLRVKVTVLPPEP